MGKRIWDFSHGIDDREIQAHRERKSIGVERTLSENIRHLEQGIALLDNLYAELIRRIERSAPNIHFNRFRKIGVKLKFEDFPGDDLRKTGLTLSLKSFQQLLEQIWQRSQGKSIRLVGLRDVTGRKPFRTNEFVVKHKENNRTFIHSIPSWITKNKVRSFL